MTDRNARGKYRAKGDKVVIRLIDPITDVVKKLPSGIFTTTRRFMESENTILEGNKHEWEDRAIVVQGGRNVPGLKDGDLVALRHDTVACAERDARRFKSDDGVIVVCWPWDIACVIRDGVPIAVGDNAVTKAVLVARLVEDGSHYKTSSGVVLPDHLKYVEDCGIITSVGDGCADLLVESDGKHVWYTRNTGFPIKEGGVEYKVVNEKEARLVCDGI